MRLPSLLFNYRAMRTFTFRSSCNSTVYSKVGVACKVPAQKWGEGGGWKKTSITMVQVAWVPPCGWDGRCAPTIPTLRWDGVVHVLLIISSVSLAMLEGELVFRPHLFRCLTDTYIALTVCCFKHTSKHFTNIS